jgi:hypothetical protein
MTTSSIRRDELLERGLLSVDPTALISRHATFYWTDRIEIGAHSRVDDFCVLSAGAGGITIGRHVHISAMASLQGAGAITIGDFATLSARAAIYSSADDFSGVAMTNPTVPEALRMTYDRPVDVQPQWPWRGAKSQGRPSVSTVPPAPEATALQYGTLRLCHACCTAAEPTLDERHNKESA